MRSRHAVVTVGALLAGCAKSAPPTRPLGTSTRHPAPPAPVRAQPPAPPPSAPPPVPTGPLIGRWNGALTLTIAQKPQKAPKGKKAKKPPPPSTQTDVITFEIEQGPGALITFWPSIDHKDDACRFTASVTGMKATFKPQTVCTQENVDTVTTVSITSGLLEQTGNTLSVRLVVDASVRNKTAGRDVPPVIGVMTYSGTGTLIR
jgi:hypothetical protein